MAIKKPISLSVDPITAEYITTDDRDALTLSEITDEHGGDEPDALSEYYLNDGLVKSKDWRYGFRSAFGLNEFAFDDDSITPDPGHVAGTVYKRAHVPTTSPANFNKAVVIHRQPFFPSNTWRGRIGAELYEFELEEDVYPEVAWPAESNTNPDYDPAQTTGVYRMKYRKFSPNNQVPQKGNEISFSHFWGTETFGRPNGNIEIVVDSVDYGGVIEAYGSHPYSSLVSGEQRIFADIHSDDLLATNSIYTDTPQYVNQIKFIIPEDVTIIGTQKGADKAAFTIENIPDTIKVIFKPSGKIIGRGGDGGTASTIVIAAARNGEHGGAAVRIVHDGEFEIDQYHQTSKWQMWGGGGGGAAGYYRNDRDHIYGGGGGGGAGYSLGGNAMWQNLQITNFASDYNPADLSTATSLRNVTFETEPDFYQRITSSSNLLADDITSVYSVDSPFKAGRNWIFTNRGRHTAQTSKQMDFALKSKQGTGQSGGGAGGGIFFNTTLRPRIMTLPYTKPDYIDNDDASKNGDAPDYIDQVPAGFENGWIIGHIDGTGAGFYAIVEDGEIVFSRGDSYPRTINRVELKHNDQTGEVDYAVFRQQFGEQPYRSSKGYDVVYEKISFDHPDAELIKQGKSYLNQSNYDFEKEEYRWGNSDWRQKFFHGGGFTKANNTSSSGDVHKYLYFPVAKWDQGINRQFFGGVGNIINYYPANALAINDLDPEAIVVGLGQNGGIFESQPAITNGNRLNPDALLDFSSSYRNVVESQVVADAGISVDKQLRSSHQFTRYPLYTAYDETGKYKMAPGGYASPLLDGGQAGEIFPPGEVQFQIINTVGGPKKYTRRAWEPLSENIKTSFTDIYGGGGGGGAFGKKGGDAPSYNVPANQSQYENYVAPGGNQGPHFVGNANVINGLAGTQLYAQDSTAITNIRGGWREIGKYYYGIQQI